MARQDPGYTMQVFGNLGADPTIRDVNDDVVCNFNVASNRDYTDPQGEKHERVSWTRIVAWGGLGRTCHQWLKKGRQVLAEGTPKATAYINDDGIAVARQELIANTVTFGGTRVVTNEEPAGAETEEEEELPF